MRMKILKQHESCLVVAAAVVFVEETVKNKVLSLCIKTVQKDIYCQKNKRQEKWNCFVLYGGRSLGDFFSRFLNGSA